MDDCSPDQTATVAQSFRDPRIKHIRNELNLGHLKNYNKGIGLASGEYLWLISADDYLRKPYVLERYVDVMERNTRLGYVFCPAMKVQDEQETEVVSWSEHGDRDVLFRGHEFLKKLLLGNCVGAPTGMVRRVCYETISLFPLDMPNSGDWYLWCVFALYYDVAYLNEPMVCYRIHGENMSVNLKTQKPHVITDDNFAVRWTIRKRAEENNLKSIVEACKDAIATYYANLIACELYAPTIYRLTLKDCERSISHHAYDKADGVEMLARVFVALADQCYLRRDLARARQYYAAALRRQPRALRTWTKYSLLYLGNIGFRCRQYASARR